MKMLRQRSIIPGFSLTMGFSLTYLGLLVLIPLSMVFLKSSQLSGVEICRILFSPRALAAYRLSFGASFIAAAVNGVFGFLVAWVLVRYSFPLKSLADALVDLPIALPTAVAGISLTALYSPQGWIGRLLAHWGIPGSYSRVGVVIALIFIGLPFVVRTIQPVLKDVDPEVEEAALCLGASRWQTFLKVLLPSLVPATLTGFALAFARALGEYGSVVFISGNLPMSTEIVPLLIMTKLEEYDYPSATALAAFMLCVSFVLLFAINSLQWWSQRHRKRLG
jgi:sulfate transport system permease protein